MALGVRGVGARVRVRAAGFFILGRLGGARPRRRASPPLLRAPQRAVEDAADRGGRADAGVRAEGLAPAVDRLARVRVVGRARARVLGHERRRGVEERGRRGLVRGRRALSREELERARGAERRRERDERRGERQANDEARREHPPERPGRGGEARGGEVSGADTRESWLLFSFLLSFQPWEDDVAHVFSDVENTLKTR